MTESVSTLNMFKPTLSECETIMFSLSPAKYDAFLKVLSLMESDQPIYIRNSAVTQNINNSLAIAHTDLTPLLESQINLTIFDPKKYLRLLKVIKGDSDVYFISDDINKRIKVVNENINVTIPKEIEELTENVELPDFTNFQPIGNPIELTSDHRNTIKVLKSDSDFVNLMIKDDQMVGIHIPETAIIIFDQFKGLNMDESSADLLLKTYCFLPITADKYNLFLGKDLTTNTYWLATICDTNITNINIYESLNEYSEDLLI